jgi:transposase
MPCQEAASTIVSLTSTVAGHVAPPDKLARALSLRALIAETVLVTERLRVREIDDDEGRRLVRIIRRGSGSVVTWRRAQMVLLSAQGMDVAAIAKVAFTGDDRVRDVIRNFNADGFGSLYPRYKGGRPPKFTLAQRRQIKMIAKARPGDYDLPFSTWSLAKLAEFLVAEGVVDAISHEGPAHPASRGGRHLSTPEDLEGLQGPAVRGQEGPDRAAVRDRRPRGHPGCRGPGGDLLR